ncbi:MAG: sigma-70 family RNA polymerase sigma factor [Gemmatimonadetes bacterium]|nr:sigma-70 family RNA polymerase sigma factor [Gemmatimonadota bacterium]
MPDFDEQDLIRRALEGDLQAFNALVETYQNLVFSVVLRMIHDRGRAEDLTQEAFVSAYRNLRGYRGGSFKAWLLRIAKNATLDELRRRKRQPAVSIDAQIATFRETLPSPGQSPGDAAEMRELGTAIAAGLASLPADQRMAVVMVDVEGMSYEETARAMEVSIGTVKSRLNRARGRMRDFLRRQPELLPARFRL